MLKKAVLVFALVLLIAPATVHADDDDNGDDNDSYAVPAAAVQDQSTDQKQEQQIEEEAVEEVQNTDKFLKSHVYENSKGQASMRIPAGVDSLSDVLDQ